MTRSRMQKCVTLSVTEAEFVSACETAQDMLFAMRVLESMGLNVNKPMRLEMDNQGAVDLANGWSAAGRTRHISTRINFLRELKEEGLIVTQWIFECSDVERYFYQECWWSGFCEASGSVCSRQAYGTLMLMFVCLFLCL
jgi:hypothetical protein